LSSSQGEAFHGTGLTFGLSGLRPVGSCRGVSLYTTNRVSPVFGSSKSRAFASSSFSGPGGTAGSVNGATGYNDDTLVILETGAGLQWSRDVRGFNGRMFARLGVEYQYWTGSGGEAFAESFSGTGGSSTGFARARAGDHDFHLIGLAVMSGFSW